MMSESPVHTTPVRIVVHTMEGLGAKMAGPGIRALRLAEQLSAQADVRLVSSSRAELESEDFSVWRADDAQLLEHAAWADVLIQQQPLTSVVPAVLDQDVIVVSDLYDPFLLEQLQRGLYLAAADSRAETSRTVALVNDMLVHADFIICASEKQRDFWLGQLTSLGRINDRTYRADPSLRSLIDVVPFGIDEAAPIQQRHGIRGVVDGISETDKVVLWGGGIYDWFDPLTLIRAVERLARRHDDLRLFFLSTHHPNPDVGAMRMADDARALAGSLGVLGGSVFFNETWVDHERRADYFLDADLGVSTHLDHLETSFSFRTRLLDYLWAGLPIVNSAGDAFEGVIHEGGLGRIVPPGDVDALAAALEELLYDDEATKRSRSAVAEYAPRLRWSAAVTPLLAFCAHPEPAADRARLRESAAAAASEALAAAAEPPADMWTDARLLSEADALRRRVAELESSTSWKITAPLRALVGLVRPVRER